jgi:O-antigen/teichoic acid export membrane protein
LILIGWPIGEYVISHVLAIPEGRMNAAHWVFRISLASAFINMISVPFVGMFTAKQRIAEMAIYGIAQTLLSFTLAFIITQIGGDRLIIYAIGMTGILIAIQMIIIIRASSVFHECGIVLTDWFDWSRIKQIASFAGWGLIGGLGGTLRNQGTAILLNLHFGTRVNAGYGIANQVSGATDTLSAAMMGAFSPEITTSEGQGNRQRMLMLAERANKFGTILVLLFAIPLLIEMDYVLILWLKTPPQYTATFCRLILTTFLIDRLTSGYMLAVAAHGKIAAYQATLGGSLVLTLPIAWLFIKLGYSAPSVGIAFIVTICMCSFGRVIWIKHLLDVPVRQWFSKTLFPCITVALIASSIGIGCSTIMASSFFRLVCVCALTLGAILMVAWAFAMDGNERIFFKNGVKRAFEKLAVMRPAQ